MALEWGWLGLIVVYLAIRKVLGFRLDVAAGVSIYGLYLVTTRLTTGLWKFLKHSYQKAKGVHLPRPKKKSAPVSVLDINQAYRLSLSEVVLGFTDREAPVRIDLESSHTLLAGETGWGKTVIINGVIAQLVQRGQRFLDNYDLYIVDLKGSKHDYMDSWSPVCKKYISITTTGSVMESIEFLEELAQEMHASYDKRIALFIDEISHLTDQAPDAESRRRGTSVINRIVSQIRDRGFVFSATQHPHHETIKRAATGNMGRKICMRVDSKERGRLVLKRNRIPDWVMELDKGEFALLEPGKPDLIRGRSRLVKLPGDIDAVVSGVVSAVAETDIRLRLFKDSCQGLSVGSELPGVNKIAPVFDGMTNTDIAAARRNYVKAGALEPIWSKTRVQGYKLAVPYENGLSLVQEYIEQGLWRENPKALKRAE